MYLRVTSPGTLWWRAQDPEGTGVARLKLDGKLPFSFRWKLMGNPDLIMTLYDSVDGWRDTGKRPVERSPEADGPV